MDSERLARLYRLDPEFRDRVRRNTTCYFSMQMDLYEIAHVDEWVERFANSHEEKWDKS